MLKSGVVTAALCKKLAGKLSFVCSAVYGKVGRAYVRPLHNVGEDATPEEMKIVFDSLRWCRDNMRSLIHSQLKFFFGFPALSLQF